jgi:hypothetical protein
LDATSFWMFGGAPTPLEDEVWPPEVGALGFGSAILVIAAEKVENLKSGVKPLAPD